MSYILLLIDAQFLSLFFWYGLCKKILKKINKYKYRVDKKFIKTKCVLHSRKKFVSFNNMHEMMALDWNSRHKTIYFVELLWEDFLRTRRGAAGNKDIFKAAQQND